MDARYLKMHLGDCLSKCLAEVAQYRPNDPIEYMAEWLYKYSQNVKHEQQVKLEAAQLALEQQQYAEELSIQEKRRAEAERIRKEDEEKQKALEAELAAAAAAAQKQKQDSTLSGPSLPPVIEGEEPPHEMQKEATGEVVSEEEKIKDETPGDETHHSEDAQEAGEEETEDS